MLRAINSSHSRISWTRHISRFPTGTRLHHATQDEQICLILCDSNIFPKESHRSSLEDPSFNCDLAILFDFGGLAADLIRDKATAIEIDAESKLMNFRCEGILANGIDNLWI